MPAHGLTLCVTENVWPAMVAVRTRDAGCVFAGTTTATELLLVPPPGAMAISRLDAVHVQDGPDATTSTSAVPPAAVATIDGGSSANEQLDPNCVIENVCPFTLMLPLRADDPELAAIE